MRRFLLLALAITAAAVTLGVAGGEGEGWHGLRPPEGGEVRPRALAASEDGRTWYVGPGAGMFVSRAGAPWRAASLPNTVRVRDIEAASATTAYAATSGEGGRVYKTSDRGSHWSRADKGIKQAEEVYDLAVAPSAPNVLYAFATDHGGSESLLRSGNGGAGWRQRGVLPGGPGEGAELVVDAASADTVYVAMAGGLYRSGDGGAHWTRSTLGFSETGQANVTALALRRTTPRILYAGTANRGVFRSVDGGLSWQFAGDGLPKRGADYETIQQIAVDPLAQDVVYVLSGRFVPGRLSISDDGGKTWRQPTERVLRWLVPHPARRGAIVAVSADGGLLRSSDRGSHWTAIDAGLTAAQPTALAVDPRDGRTVYVGTSATGLRKSSDGAVSWTPPEATVTGQVDALAIAPRNPRIIYLATPYEDGRGILKSSDSGSTWTTVGGTELEARALAVDPRISTTLLAADVYGGIRRSIDGGRTWQDTFVSDPIDTIAFDPARPTVVYAGASSVFNDLRGFGAYVSRNSGKRGTWEPINDGLGRTGSIPPEVYDLAVARTSEVYAATSRGVYELGRGETRWTNLSRGLPSRRNRAATSVLAIAVNPRTGTAYATTPVGTYLLERRPDKAGRSWRLAAPRLANERGGELGFAADGSRLYLVNDHSFFRLDHPG